MIVVCICVDWQCQVEGLYIFDQVFIDGCYVDVVSGVCYVCISLIDGCVLVQVVDVDYFDVDCVVVVVCCSFEVGYWLWVVLVQCKQVLLRLVELVECDVDELVLLEILDMGKLVCDVWQGDLVGVLCCLCWIVEVVDKVYGEVVFMLLDMLGLIICELIGVVVVIVFWNFLLLMVCWKIVLVLVVGNLVVFKLFECLLLSVLWLVVLVVEVGVFDGVFNVLFGYGQCIGEFLVLYMDVDVFVFIGFMVVGWWLLQCVGQFNFKWIWLECGGKSLNLVFVDVLDLDIVVQVVVIVIFYNQGEVCMVGLCLLVQCLIKDVFVVCVFVYGWYMQLQYLFELDVVMGVLVDDVYVDCVFDYVVWGEVEGVCLLFGGWWVEVVVGGSYVEFIVFDEVDLQYVIVCEEIFGFVFVVIFFDYEEDVLCLVNDLVYGLVVGVWMCDFGCVYCVVCGLCVGSVWVN